MKDFILGRSCQKYSSVIGGGWGWRLGLQRQCLPRRHTPGSGRAWPHMDTVLGERKEKSGLGVVTSKELGDMRKGQAHSVPGLQWPPGLGNSLCQFPGRALSPPVPPRSRPPPSRPPPNSSPPTSLPGASSGWWWGVVMV